MNLSRDWEVQPCFQVRSAGFPAHWLAGFDTSTESQFERRVEVERDHLAQIWSNPRLQEAMIWQNPKMASNFLFSFLDKYPYPENSKVRRIQRKLLLYAQRYCAKNEAIGYFGPIGWGQLNHEIEKPQESAAEWLVERSVYLEPWLFHHLWENSSEDLQSKMPLMLNPKIRMDGNFLVGDRRCRDRRGRIRLSSEELECLRTRGESCSADSPVLRKCVSKRWLVRSPAIPASPKLLQEYSEKQTGYFASQTLDTLGIIKRKLEAGRDEPRRLVKTTLSVLEDLEPLTCGKAERGRGKFYEGRLPFYEDCQRRSLDLPAEWLSELSKPICLLLESARWLCVGAEAIFRTKLDSLCRGLVATRGEGFSATHLWERLQKSWGDSDLDFRPVVKGLSERFEAVFGTSSQPQEFSCEEVEKQWRGLFATSTSAAPLARFHSIDLFLSEDHGPVLGEIHPALYPFNDISTNFQHSNPDTLSEWYSTRASEPEIWPAQLLAFSRLAHDGWANPKAFHLLTHPRWGSWRPEQQQLRLGDFAVYPEADSFLVQHQQRDLSFSPLEFLQAELVHQLYSLYKPFAESERRGRVKLGPLVIARQGWALNEKLLLDLKSSPREQRFQAFNEKLDHLGVPNTFYGHFEQELKPIYFRRDSVLFVDLFFSLLKAGKKCRVEEALPEPTSGWISNPDGKGCGEFRFAFFDTGEGFS